jgi:hypothetical protein
MTLSPMSSTHRSKKAVNRGLRKAEIERFLSQYRDLEDYQASHREELIPWLYSKGNSTSDFTEALEALVGRDSPRLSAATISMISSLRFEVLGGYISAAILVSLSCQ